MFKIPTATQAFWARLDIKPASEEQIAEIAALAPGPLPQDYVSFLRTYGFSRWMLTVPDQFHSSQEIGGRKVVKTRSVSHLESPESLRRAMKYAWTDQPELGLPCWPPGVTPVAGNAGSDQVLMDFEQSPGAILFWEPAADPWGNGSNTRLWKVAPNFAQFINGLMMRAQA